MNSPNISERKKGRGKRPITISLVDCGESSFKLVRMSICTGRGQDGMTDLLFGKQVRKSDQRIAVCGNIDELNAHVGLVRSAGASDAVIEILDRVQQNLVALMGEVATQAEDLPKYKEQGYSRLSEEDREWVLGLIKEAESGDNPVRFRGWARPGKAGVLAASFLDVCRTICRRSEREFWAWDEQDTYLLHKRYLNQLSDLFWLLAREAEKEA